MMSAALLVQNMQKTRVKTRKQQKMKRDKARLALLAVVQGAYLTTIFSIMEIFFVAQIFSLRLPAVHFPFYLLCECRFCKCAGPLSPLPSHARFLFYSCPFPALAPTHAYRQLFARLGCRFLFAFDYQLALTKPHLDISQRTPNL
jgi:hypothetical protein